MKKKQGTVFLVFILGILLSGCLGGLWTGASFIYTRHDVYKKVSDYQLSMNANYALYHDKLFKTETCVIDLAIFNGDILMAGHVPNYELRQIAMERISKIKGYRKLFNQLDVSNKPSNTLEDSWITAKIKSLMVADANISPDKFKIITSDRIVYLMGDVDPSQAMLVINIAKNSAGVERVVKLLNYYHLSNQAVVAH